MPEQEQDLKKNILILYSGVGFGHKMISQNIGHALERRFNVDLVNLYEIENGAVIETGTKIFLWILRRWPSLWKFFYLNKIFLALTLPFRRFAASFKYKKVLSVLSQKKYDAVITTHASCSAVLSYIKKHNLYDGRFIVAFSDFHLHPYWLFDNADYYLANIPEQKEQMEQLGIASQKIGLFGITLKEKQSYDVAQLKNKYGIAPEQKVILVLGGGQGMGINKNIISSIQGLGKVLVVCGKNQSKYKELQSFTSNMPEVELIGFTDSMQELYALADLVLTKPGGLTIAECLQFQLPVVVTHYLPGQEQLNYEFLLARNLVMPTPPQQDWYGFIKKELAHGTFSVQLRDNKNIRLIVKDPDVLTEAVCGFMGV